MTWGQGLLTVAMITVCGFLMLVILIQRGRGSGLVGAFGGGGGSAAFGAKTGDVLTWITVVVAGLFLLLAVVSNYAFDQAAQGSAPGRATAALPGTTDPGSGATPSTPGSESPISGGAQGGDAAGAGSTDSDPSGAEQAADPATKQDGSDDGASPDSGP